MNVIEMIAHCNKNGIPGAILSIDQAKALDSVSHKYMHQVYRFFGFGPNFIRLLETLGNGRTACIAFEDGTYSTDFELKCGRAQGNTSSPTEYNMGQQILHFKIELCPEIKSLYQSHFISRPLAPAPVENFFATPRYRIGMIQDSGMNHHSKPQNVTGSRMITLQAHYLNLSPYTP